MSLNKIINKCNSIIVPLKWWKNTNIWERHVHEEITNRLKSENVRCHSVQNHLSSSLLSKNIKIKICRTTVLSAALYGVKHGRT